MPIEARSELTAAAIPPNVGQAFLHEAGKTLEGALAKIGHCLSQLDDRHVQWRPNESHNSIQTIILHLCGNVRQWIIHAAGGEPDSRNRPLEFSDRRPIDKQALMKNLSETVHHAVAVLDRVTPDRLLNPCRVQGFDTYLLAAIWDSVSHFVGHTHQIVYITRQLIGAAYVFQFVPANVEQGA
jgi:hypothetical protein